MSSGSVSSGALSSDLAPLMCDAVLVKNPIMVGSRVLQVYLLG